MKTDPNYPEGVTQKQIDNNSIFEDLEDEDEYEYEDKYDGEGEE